MQWFVRGVPSAKIAHETRLDRKRVLRALTAVRQAMTRSAPDSVRRVSETEIAPGSRAGAHHLVTPHKPGKPLRPGFAVLGLYAADGRVAAEVIPDREAEQFGRMLRGRKAGQSVASPPLYRYGAVVYRGHLHRLAEFSDGRAPFGQIEAFWAYLQRQLRAKGGIRPERRGLYLAEYVWRYNHRNLSPDEQLRALLKLIRQHPTKWNK